jgi:hypothetical protein
MLSKNIFSIRNAAFVLLFIALTLIADQVKVSAIWGSPGQTFTLFQMIGPLPGFFLGPVVGVISVLVAEIVGFIALGKTVDLVNILRLLPMLAAAYYFGTAGKLRRYSLVIPIVAMALFVLNPVGSQAWAYSLYWLIPIICALAKPNSLFFKALGATFMAHCMGSIVWLYLVNPMTPELWMALIPVVAMERFSFAIGITVSFVAVNALLNRFFSESKVDVLNIEKHISLF